MAVVANEEKCSCLGHVDLHPNQTICMTWQVVRGDALAKVHGLVAECFPVPVQLAQVHISVYRYIQ